MDPICGWLDANIVLRYLLNDHPEHSPRAGALVERAERGEVKLKVAPHIVCEIVYVLESQEYSREEIYTALSDFSRIEGVELVDADVVLEAALDYKDKNVDFLDALLASISRTYSEKVWTFNKKHFARMEGVLEEPGL
ncbi:MAG: PIN domain-containing protein [Candidatus Fermentithermobacillus carboniphilus]|uniref:PIN domain-containing protein n=1 Tax=Candidatus Fermentithermobacillus carboniphilus TaxID=3085328 RepID=A0AAT9LC53_9FIRM|nr:MAG: PIN domain-containing protein [Candidatus Fermentithermobacillus carboniphilus]